MSIDALQEKIRKRKSALIVDMTIYPGQLPEHWAGECFENGYKQYVLELLKGLKGSFPASASGSAPLRCWAARCCAFCRSF